MSATVHHLQKPLSQKSWSTLLARAALRGYQLWRTDPDDGVQRFFAGRFGVVRAFGSQLDVDLWLTDLEAPKA